MGCVISIDANNDDARSCAYKVDNMVRKPKPWAYGNSPLSSRELQQMRSEFWHNAIRAGGRREIWEALRAATEGNLLNAQKIIEDKNIRLGNQDMSVCYDDNVRFCYCIVADNDNITYRVDEKRKCRTHKDSII
ncbi:ubiquitin domain-containing protein 1 [Tanacetum coccineum]